MKKVKNALLTILGLALVAVLSVAGTLAYLQDDDSDVNVMTMGNVKIAQHEYERVQNEDGTYPTKEIDGKTSYILKEFTQDKPLYPAIIPNGGTVGGVTWDYDSIPVRMSQVKSHGGASVFNTPNAQDKFVTVENTGRSDAYVRTIIAFEVGTATLEDPAYPYQPLIASEIRAEIPENNKNGKQPWTYGYTGFKTINGNKYLVYELIYTGAMTSSGWKHENGVLPAGETTYPNLSQVYLASRATNEDVEALDGNGNGKYDILVLSQAVQTKGFDNAQAALDTAFGKAADKAVEWFGGISVFDTWDGETDTSWFNADANYTLTTAEQLAGFAELVNGGESFKGKTITLASNIDLVNKEWTPIGNSSNTFQGTFDGNGNTISNLNVAMEGKSNVGLFGMTTDGSVKNVHIDNAKVVGRLNVGVVAGTPYTSKYENIKVTGKITVEGMSYVGAIGGKNAYANWTDITVDVEEGSYVKANSVENGTAYRTYVGGVVGFMGEGGHTMSNVKSNIDVIGSTIDAGGIVGIAHYGNSFINCSSSGNVTITDAETAEDAEEIGGIAGVWNNGGSPVTFENCKYTGKLSVNVAGVDLSNNTITGNAYSSSGSGQLIIK